MRGLAVGLSGFAVMMASASAARADVVSAGVGALGGVGVVGLGKPGDTTVSPGVQDTTYPGFFGGTAGAGLAADVRLFGIAGIEADLFYAFGEKGDGDLTLGNTTFTITTGQPALHVPVLAKAVLPTGILRPFIGFGPEFVLPGKSTAEVSPAGIQTAIGARADAYTLLTLALGLEIKLPIPAVDLRIPIALRASLNPGTSDKITDRRDATLVPGTTGISAITYRSEWQYQGMLTAGVSYWF